MGNPDQSATVRQWLRQSLSAQCMRVATGRPHTWIKSTCLPLSKMGGDTEYGLRGWSFFRTQLSLRWKISDAATIGAGDLAFMEFQEDWTIRR